MTKFLCIAIGGCMAARWIIDTAIMIASQL